MLFQGYKYIIFLIIFIIHYYDINAQPGWPNGGFLVIDTIDTLSFTKNDNDNKFLYCYKDELINDSNICEQAFEKICFYSPISDTFQVVKHVVIFQYPNSLYKIIILHKMHKMEIEIIDPLEINWYVSILFEDGHFILDCKLLDPLNKYFDKSLKLKNIE